MLLFLDTETTGLPRDWKAPITNLDNWPRMVQLAWLLYDEQAVLQGEGNVIIQPDGYVIPTAVSKIHGITQAKAQAEGIPLGDALAAFDQALAQAHTLVAHNLSFDERILGAEYLRVRGENPLTSKQGLCTQVAGTPVCRLPGTYGRYKWPRLDELYRHLFHEKLEGAHDAAVDIAATARCFWALRGQAAI
jgi:DNA polymerase III epsilon subunit-like protein